MGFIGYNREEICVLELLIGKLCCFSIKISKLVNSNVRKIPVSKILKSLGLLWTKFP